MEYRYLDEGKKKHYHELDGKPLVGTSSVASVIAKPLHWWALQIGLGTLGYMPQKKRVSGKYVTNKPEDRLKLATEGMQRIIMMTPDKYLEALDEAYYAHDKVKNDSAKTGTDLHAELEKYVKNTMLCNDPNNKGGNMIDTTFYPEEIHPFIQWAQANVKRFLWSEGHCYSRVHWLGGITDVGAELNDGSYIIIDFKSSKEAYHSQFWQCAGYDIQVSENGVLDKDGNVKFTLDKPISAYAIVPFGAEKVEPVFRYNVEECKGLFLASLKIYKAVNNS